MVEKESLHLPCIGGGRGKRNLTGGRGYGGGCDTLWVSLRVTRERIE